ncbi:hypothetical protein INT47_005275, partial [Mucor saturninus]
GNNISTKLILGAHSSNALVTASTRIDNLVDQPECGPNTQPMKIFTYCKSTTSITSAALSSRLLATLATLVMRDDENARLEKSKVEKLFSEFTKETKAKLVILRIPQLFDGNDFIPAIGNSGLNLLAEELASLLAPYISTANKKNTVADYVVKTRNLWCRNSTTFVSEFMKSSGELPPEESVKKKQEDFYDSNEFNDSIEPTSEEVKDYLIFVGKQGGLPSTEIVSPVEFNCQCGSEKVFLTKTVRMYFFNAIKDVSVCYCSCKPLAEALMLMGMFPSSPSSPKSAIHLGLLGFFNEVRNTLKSSSEGIAKLCNNLRGNPVQSCLSANICRNVLYMYNRLLLVADKEVNQRTALKDQAMCCPACPSRDSNHLMDRIFITMDGCFSMKCKSKASLLGEIFTIDTVENAWVKPESVELYKKEQPPKDVSIMKGNGASYKSKLYPVKGLFAASCARHDLTLKMVDMDSGEGFKYPLSVLHDLFQEDKDSIKTPVNVICVLEKSLTTHFPYLTANGTLALPVFHAYAHVISCQSSFNPKNIESYGRTDGEASERLWSSLRPFVTITRPMSQANKRLTLTLAIRHRNMEKKWGMGATDAHYERRLSQSQDYSSFPTEETAYGWIKPVSVIEDNVRKLKIGILVSNLLVTSSVRLDSDSIKSEEFVNMVLRIS